MEFRNEYHTRQPKSSCPAPLFLSAGRQRESATVYPRHFPGGGPGGGRSNIRMIMDIFLLRGGGPGYLTNST